MTEKNKSKRIRKVVPLALLLLLLLGGTNSPVLFSQAEPIAPVEQTQPEVTIDEIDVPLSGLPTQGLPEGTTDITDPATPTAPIVTIPNNTVPTAPAPAEEETEIPDYIPPVDDTDDEEDYTPSTPVNPAPQPPVEQPPVEQPPVEEPGEPEQPEDPVQLGNTQATLKAAQELIAQFNACTSYDEKRALLGVTGAAGNNELRDKLCEILGGQMLTLEEDVVAAADLPVNGTLYIQTYFSMNSAENPNSAYAILYAHTNSTSAHANAPWATYLVYNENDGNWYKHTDTHPYNGKLETKSMVDYQNATPEAVAEDLASEHFEVVGEQVPEDVEPQPVEPQKVEPQTIEENTTEAPVVDPVPVEEAA